MYPKKRKKWGPICTLFIDMSIYGNGNVQWLINFEGLSKILIYTFLNIELNVKKMIVPFLK